MRKASDLTKALNLGHIRLPRTYAVSLRNDNKGTYLTASLRDGRILSSHLLSKPKKESQWFKTMEPTGVNRYDERVAKLSFLLREIAERGFSDKSYKSFKRLHLVAFTTSIRNLSGLVKKILTNLPKRRDKTRHPTVCQKHLLCKPSFTGEKTKSRRNSGRSIPLWDWIPIVKSENFTSDSEDGWC